ncbi:hypothetical protein BG006_001853 [Podila minutissima]|uniref:Uncharacterized protein n=1 Tax=Podila minutissima TaxID=64525 RepID=A0A9P5S9U7_9FUNG|nr:hypothetical protein BG006_001853 [Podila minutissima]
MVSSPTDEFPQQTSESLLSVIAQKEARIAQLREDLETNLSELTQLKERWSQMMMEERTRQQAEASASIQQQEEKLYGHSAQSVSHRLSTTGAGLWGSVVGSVSGISGVSGGITLHNINSIHHHHIPTDQEPSQPKLSQSKGRINRSDSQRAQSPSRPTSPLPAYLTGFASLNGLDSPSSKGAGTSARGDRASLSSLSTCSSSLSGDGPTAFEAGHSSQSSFSSAGGEHSQALKDRESRRTRRESGLFIPPEAEEVLVNTGRALFKGFGSLIGGIRTVVNDVAESDRFQHSRQRTMDMVSGLAQTAADALPLPSHDDIYYHHQRLNLLDEEDEEGISPELLLQQQKIQLQHAKEQRRLERLMEKERRLQERNRSGDILDPAEPSAAVDSSSARPAGTLVRRSSSRLKTKTMTGEGEVSLSRTVSQLLIHEDKKGDLEEGGEWDSLEDKALMASLEETLAKKVEVPEADLLGLGLIDTPNPSSKKDD